MATSFVWRDESPETAPAPGSVVLTCFPSAGLAAIVAAHYMVRALNLPRVGVLDSDDALPLAVIQRGEVQPAIRVYGKAGLNIVLSEFPPSFSSVRPIADGILDGAERLRARLLIAVEGVVPHPTESDEDDPRCPKRWSGRSPPDGMRRSRPSSNGRRPGPSARP
jgi:predicted ATP-grasp superfamily ATP-dependent carboligase